MAALVQSYPTQSSTVTMLQTRPTSASGIPSQGHPHYNPASQMNRNSYHGISSSTGQTTYRGHTSIAPVAPYAFTSTPSLSGNGGRVAQASPYLRTDQRTSSAPVLPTVQAAAANRSRYPAPASISTTSTASSSDISSTAKSTRDDSSISSNPSYGLGATKVPPPQTTIITSGTLLPPASLNSPTVKSSPDRYRRPGNRRTDSAGAGSNNSPNSSGSASPVVPTAAQSNSQPPPANYFQAQQVQLPLSSQFGPSIRTVDDMNVYRHGNTQQSDAARYRRRSIHTIEMGKYDTGDAQSKGFQQGFQAGLAAGNSQHPLRSSPVGPIRPSSSPGRSGTSESLAASRNNQGLPTLASTTTKREPSVVGKVQSANPAPSTSAVEELSPNHDQLQLVNIPPRGSSTDAAKRIANPSPLSKPTTMSPESPSISSKDQFQSTVSAAYQTTAKQTYAQVANGARPASPAAKQLAALNDKEAKKSKTSRLRRAFSFGSAAELRKASNEPTADNPTLSATDRARLRKERYQDEREAEQAKIAERQEAGGIGQSIYSGQGNYFTGSTDNLSISSTASSASIMLRKMGQGVKKSTRSLVGLFRPKSVIGVPAADASLPEFSQAQVSMVTVEAERERVNVHASPHAQVGGGTGYPKLERNSIDAANATIASRESLSASETPTSRRSIVGGENDRQEVLAAVKKGILKRSATDSPSSSPMIRPVDTSKTPNFNLPQIPHVNDSPISSAPSTPNEDAQGHKRTESVLNGDDYFMSALRFRSDSKSVPATPMGTLKRNATFSPRIQFHDTWPSGEYDRRGEIATCNRLTPMLAQQIKEELNTFKMEMEVHENSKIYTHFF